VRTPRSWQDCARAQLADGYCAVRLDADEWKLALGIDPSDDAAGVRLETQPYEELVRRVAERTANGGIPITADHMETYRETFQPPTDEELSLFDPPLRRAGH
jgi:hypothetical protein